MTTTRTRLYRRLAALTLGLTGLWLATGATPALNINQIVGL